VKGAHDPMAALVAPELSHRVSPVKATERKKNGQVALVARPVSDSGDESTTVIHGNRPLSDNGDTKGVHGVVEHAGVSSARPSNLSAERCVVATLVKGLV
jgi:hypothetical protein